MTEKKPRESVLGAIQFRTEEQTETMRKLKAKAALKGVRLNQLAHEILKEWLTKQVD